MKILILSADRFEDSELLVPLARLREAGMQVDIGSFTTGTIHGKHGESAHANRTIAEIRPENYDALLLPGGKAPAALRQDAQVLELVRHFFAAGKPVAAICHGPQVLISAGVLAGGHGLSLRGGRTQGRRRAVSRCRGGGGWQSRHLAHAGRPARLPARVHQETAGRRSDFGATCGLIRPRLRVLHGFIDLL